MSEPGHTMIGIHERKTRTVVFLTAVTMLVEIFFGFYTNSMALLADGWHMSSHALALGLSWTAYAVSRKHAESPKFSFNRDKLLALSGLISAIILQAIAIFMVIEAIERLVNPIKVHFSEALLVSFIGLAVNVLSAFLLHHDKEYSDHNIRSAYIHVLADAVTSVTAIVAILAGMLFNLVFIDSIGGLIGSLVITRWAINLIIDSGKLLIDFKKK